MFVAALAADLFVATRIESAIRAAGADARMVDSGHGLWDAIERWPELVLIDLSTPGWEEPVRRAKTLPQTRAIPIVAFGSHVDTLHAACGRGRPAATTPGRAPVSSKNCPACSRTRLYPPTRFVPGWDEPPPPALLHGIEQFNAGEYWECHETLEGLWIAEHARGARPVPGHPPGRRRLPPPARTTTSRARSRCSAAACPGCAACPRSARACAWPSCPRPRARARPGPRSRARPPVRTSRPFPIIRLQD